MNATPGTHPNSLVQSVPHAEMVVWSDAGHSADLEHPERFAALVLAWLRRIGVLCDGDPTAAAMLRSKY
jgi:pimeloyl-ACP methyl ester carboxylesterase